MTDNDDLCDVTDAMAKTKFTEFESLLSVKVPVDLRERLDAELAKERAARRMMATSMSDIVRTLLVEALDARNEPPPNA